MLEKWWNNNLYRHLVVSAIEESKIDDGSKTLDYETFMEKRKWLRDKSKNTLKMQQQPIFKLWFIIKCLNHFQTPKISNHYFQCLE